MTMKSLVWVVYMASCLLIHLVSAFQSIFPLSSLLNDYITPTTTINIRSHRKSTTSTIRWQSNTAVVTPSIDNDINYPHKTPLSMSIDELSVQIGGKGRALSAWDCFRIGATQT